MNEEYTQQTNKKIIQMLQCPMSKQPLSTFIDSNNLCTLATQSGKKYPINKKGIPLFAQELTSKETKAQQQHYEKVAQIYQQNLSYPHTQVYTQYLDQALLYHVKKHTHNATLGMCVELCCGTGEAIKLLHQSMTNAIGIDVSESMLEAAYQQQLDMAFFIQGDATNIPIKDQQVDSVVMLGGIHHVPNREKLFAEIYRILKPNGIFIYREPVSDFWLWKALRAIIYHLSPALDHETERPLLFKETIPLLEHAGFINTAWQTYGFVGFCVFMNSDVLWFNRFFRFIPGIRFITKIATIIDDKIAKLPFCRGKGLQVIGVSRKLEQNNSSTEEN